MSKFAIVVSSFNAEITDELLAGALKQFKFYKIKSSQLEVVRVPGAVEIPLAAQLLAKTKRFQAIICLGSVIKGETDHYQYVCEQVNAGCLRVMLDHSIPVIFYVLMTKNIKLARARIGGNQGHKGEEAVDTAITMVEITKKLSE